MRDEWPRQSVVAERHSPVQSDFSNRTDLATDWASRAAVAGLGHAVDWGM